MQDQQQVAVIMTAAEWSAIADALIIIAQSVDRAPSVARDMVGRADRIRTAVSGHGAASGTATAATVADALTSVLRGVAGSADAYRHAQSTRRAVVALELINGQRFSIDVAEVTS